MQALGGDAACKVLLPEKPAENNNRKGHRDSSLERTFDPTHRLSDGDPTESGTGKADSQGKVSMGPGTLYGSLKRMLDAWLVRESDRLVDHEMDDQRRIYYEVTEVGRKALAAELDRYKHIVTLARQRKLHPNTLA